MIVFELECRSGGHRFEGWFGSSAEFTAQAERGLIECPACGSPDVVKAPMAPRLGRKGNQAGPASPKPERPAEATPAIAAPTIPPPVLAAMRAMAAVQAEAIKSSRWVGEGFAEESRAMHYGERDRATIHGQATRDEAQALIEEGIAIAPLLFPIAPPDELN
ncbi:MAG: DUF1178 family protein [Novosphingobium sp.]